MNRWDQVNTQKNQLEKEIKQLQETVQQQQIKMSTLQTERIAKDTDLQATLADQERQFTELQKMHQTCGALSTACTFLIEQRDTQQQQCNQLQQDLTNQKDIVMCLTAEKARLEKRLLENPTHS